MSLSRRATIALVAAFGVTLVGVPSALSAAWQPWADPGGDSGLGKAPITKVPADEPGARPGVLRPEGRPRGHAVRRRVRGRRPRHLLARPRRGPARAGRASRRRAGRRARRRRRSCPRPRRPPPPTRRRSSPTRARPAATAPLSLVPDAGARRGRTRGRPERRGLRRRRRHRQAGAGPVRLRRRHGQPLRPVPAVVPHLGGRRRHHLQRQRAETGGSRHVRFVTTPDCPVEVAEVEVPAGALDTFSATISALRTLGFNRTDRKYMIFGESQCLLRNRHVRRRRPGRRGQPQQRRPVVRPQRQRLLDRRRRRARAGAQPRRGQQQRAATPAGRALRRRVRRHVLQGHRHGTVTRVVCADRAQDQRLDCNHDDYYHTNPSAGQLPGDPLERGRQRVPDRRATTAAPPRPVPDDATTDAERRPADDPRRRRHDAARRRRPARRRRRQPDPTTDTTRPTSRPDPDDRRRPGTQAADGRRDHGDLGPAVLAGRRPAAPGTASSSTDGRSARSAPPPCGSSACARRPSTGSQIVIRGVPYTDVAEIRTPAATAAAGRLVPAVQRAHRRRRRDPRRADRRPHTAGLPCRRPAPRTRPGSWSRSATPIGCGRRRGPSASRAGRRAAPAPRWSRPPAAPRRSLDAHPHGGRVRADHRRPGRGPRPVAVRRAPGCSCSSGRRRSATSPGRRCRRSAPPAPAGGRRRRGGGAHRHPDAPAAGGRPRGHGVDAARRRPRQPLGGRRLGRRPSGHRAHRGHADGDVGGGEHRAGRAAPSGGAADRRVRGRVPAGSWQVTVDAALPGIGHCAATVTVGASPGRPAPPAAVTRRGRRPLRRRPAGACRRPSSSA